MRTSPLRGMRTSPLRTVLVAGAAALAVLLAGCGDDSSSGATGDSESPAVLASTTIWADVTSNVGCGEIEVVSLIPAGTDAHEFEPSVQDADALRGADLVVANGLGLEEGLHDSLETASADGVTVLELAPELSPLDTEEEHADEEHAEDEHAEDEHAEESEDGHDHDGADPHVWMDPDRVAAAVPMIADALAEIDGLPVDAEQIQTCADDYVAELTELSAQMDESLAAVPAERRQLVTNHEALGYFADRFDFEVVGAVIPSTSTLGESNARELDELAETMRDKGVTAIFAETTGSSDVADALAERTGSEVSVVELFTESLGEPGSGAATYLEMMSTNAELIATHTSG